MTTSPSDLDRLAELVGIEPFFFDIWGNRTDVRPEAKRALITALGYGADSDAEIADSLHEIETAPWRRLAPPVLVVGADEDILLPLTVFDSELDRPAHWTMVEETGAVHEGEGRLAELVLGGMALLKGVAMRRLMLPLPLRPPLGYHSLTVRQGQREARLSLIVAPERCLTADDLVTGGRTWGLGVQLYGVRSAGNWGMGDFTDLAGLGELAGRRGAGVVGLNPLHALFAADPHHYSPYSPSHRGFLNVFYIDPVAVPELAECPEARDLIGSPAFQRALAGARASELVDYPAVAALKRPVLERLFRAFQTLHLEPAEAEEPSARATAFRAFQAEGGEEMYRFALFEALHEHFFGSDFTRWNWQDWPAAYRDPASPEVAAFAAAYPDRVSFFQYLQWLADQQLGDAAAKARGAGLAVGFYRDLAVAVSPGGATAWAEPLAIALGARIGCPPDQFNLKGQNWGLAPFSPIGLVETAYRPFIAVLRANMRHAGMLRIDHVMALQHLYWIPPDGGIGGYLSYPFRDLVRLVALESHRNRCIVIGEDLGTVPEGFRPAMEQAGILSCRVFYFERGHDGGFLPPGAYPASALVTATTHDLATLAGFWQGRDLAWRSRLGLYPSAEIRDGEARSRDHDRWRLLDALAAAGVLPDRLHPRHGRIPALDDDLAAAIYRFLARSPAQVLMVQIEDLLLDPEQPNLPGTVAEHPNWRRRLALALDQIGRLDGVARLAGEITASGR
ncbi:MAG: 4-alpha-glucanotransferase [Rhodospirillaceae bacterium]